MPKIILKIPPKNLGLLINTTFTECTLSYLQAEIPSIITHIANTATKNLGGQKQLIRRPNAKVSANAPLPELHLLRILIPPKSFGFTVTRFERLLQLCPSINIILAFTIFVTKQKNNRPKSRF